MLPLANILQPLIDFSEAIMVFFHDNAGFSWGTSIIMLTVVIRLLILPLTFKQVRSMQALQRLQPELKKIQERYKDDRQRMNQEMMGFYQKHGVNPLSSCLPVLLQLPFFLALFYMLRADLRERICEQTAKPCGEVAGSVGHQFLFIGDLTAKETGGALIVLIVLYVGSQLVSGLITTFTADKTQRTMMMALPFVFVVFIINFEAGLIVYWVTTNFWTIGQQVLVKKLLPAPDPIEVSDDDGGKPARGKPPAPKPAGAAAVANGGKGSAPAKAPPPGPRKRKRRSGRRR